MTIGQNLLTNFEIVPVTGGAKQRKYCRKKPFSSNQRTASVTCCVTLGNLLHHSETVLLALNLGCLD